VPWFRGENTTPTLTPTHFCVELVGEHVRPHVCPPVLTLVQLNLLQPAGVRPSSQMRASLIATLIVVATAFAPTLCAPLEYVFFPLNFEISADLLVAPRFPHATVRLMSAPFPYVTTGWRPAIPLSSPMIPILSLPRTLRLHREIMAQGVAVRDATPPMQTASRVT
jgi:hypothetical protein